MSKTVAQHKVVEGSGGKVSMISLDKLEVNPWNCNIMSDSQMKSLQNSMSKNGEENVQPLVVRSLGSGKFQIVDGEHRYLAAKQLKWDALPAVVAEIDDEHAKVMCLALNYIRGKIDPIRLFDMLYKDWEGGGEGKLTTRELEEQYGHLFDQSWIVRILRLRNLAPQVKEAVKGIYNHDPDTMVSLKHLIVISQLKDNEDQSRFLKALLATNVSVGTLERMVREYLAGKEGKSSAEYNEEIVERKAADLGSSETHSAHQERTVAQPTPESMLKCVTCGSSYMVNWRRKSVLRLVEEGSHTKALHVQLS